MENTNNSSTQSSPSGQTNSNTNTGGTAGNSQASGLNMDSITNMLGGLNIPDAVKKYSGSATKAISGLTTTQKVIGGAILLLGATYLTRGSRGGWMKKAGAIGGLGKMAMGKNKGKH